VAPPSTALHRSSPGFAAPTAAGALIHKDIGIGEKQQGWRWLRDPKIAV